jgi:hypothetical protein
LLNVSIFADIIFNSEKTTNLKRQIKCAYSKKIEKLLFLEFPWQEAESPGSNQLLQFAPAAKEANPLRRQLASNSQRQ